MSAAQKPRNPFLALAPALQRHWGNLVLAMLAASGAQAIGLALPLLARWTIRQVTHRRPPTALSLTAAGESALMTFGVVLGGLLLLRVVLRWQEGVCGARVAQRVIAEVRQQMYRHLQGFSAGYFDRRASGKILVRFVGDANALQNWLSRICVTVPADVLTLLGVGIAISLVNYQLLVAALAPLVLILPALLWINPRVRRWTREGRKQQTQLCGHLNTRIAALKVIQAANAQSLDHAEAADMIDGVAAANLNRARLDAWSQALAVAATTAGLGAVVLWGAWLLGHRLTTNADLMACLWLTLNSRGPISRLSRANTIHQRAWVAVERISALLGRAQEPGLSPALRPYAGPGRTIRLKNVGYRTPDGQWLLRHVSRSFTGPGLVAVSDQMGHGKGALLELLLRLRRPHEGRIYLDGEDVRELRVVDVRRQLGWVDAGAAIVDTLGSAARPDPPCDGREAPAALWRSLELIAPSARNQADGTDFAGPPPVLGDSVRRTLPREQRLRLALFYVLSQQPSVLLLDEPTVGLPADGAARFVQWLQDTAQQKLVLVATQDPRVIAAAGQHLVLEGDPEAGAPVATSAGPPSSGRAEDDSDAALELSLRPVAAEG